MDSMDQTLAAEWAALQKARVFFGHQSVGKDILGGLQDLAEKAGLPAPNVIRAGEGDALPESFLLHAFVGENEKPDSKCRSMETYLRAAPPAGFDAALMKFCYIDFNRHTDVEAVLADYKGMMEGLKARHPHTVFVHATVPLTSISTRNRLTAPIKRLLGRPHPESGNIKRNQFNRRLLETFPGEPVFDLAAAESTFPDGKRETFKAGSDIYYSLVNAYTYDGGHLNAAGSRRGAREFVRALSGALALADSRKGAMSRSESP